MIFFVQKSHDVPKKYQNVTLFQINAGIYDEQSLGEKADSVALLSEFLKISDLRLE